MGMGALNPLCVDLYCGLGGWTEGFISAGYDVLGFDITMQPYAGQRVIQDVTTIHGAQFAGADVIVASPPCQEFSYRAMPWKRAKAQVPETLPEWWNKPEAKMDALELAAWHSWRAEHPADLPLLGLKLFWACFRIQHEACEAAGRYIPMVIENVKGAQKWVGEAQAHFGSYYLWGDVRAVGRKIVGRPELTPLRFGEFTASRRAKTAGHVNQRDGFSHTRHLTNQAESDGVKQNGSGPEWFDNGICKTSSKSDSRKAASAAIAKIPFPLAQHIARVFKPAVV